jgi:predicted TIM-barrel fold metal-dependent hydrolase
MTLQNKLLILFSALMIAVVTLSWLPARAQTTSDDEALRSLAALHPIDAHVHVFKTSPAFQKLLEAESLTLLNILVVDDTLPYRKELQPQIDVARQLVASSNEHIFLCTTFDPFRFNDAGFSSDSVKQINRDFKDGAIAVKIWKNVGMEIKESNGRYILPDDAKFNAIYKDIARQGKTLLAHLAEPDIAWQPLDPKANPLSSYYLENPQWHMLNKPGIPSKQMILKARDHVLEQNPNLRVVGVHLGSMEADLDDIGRHLDRFPNFAVDTAARMEYLMFGPTQRVRDFLLKYQDRVIYGTDLDVLSTAKIEDTIKDWKVTYINDWKFFATDETFDVEGRKVQGLKLPPDVLQKIYRHNAEHWIKGL